MKKIVTVLVPIFLGLLFISPLIDTDFGWHLRIGEHIVTTLSVPSVDLFSHSYSGTEYLYHSWLSEVLLYLSYILLNGWGVSLLYAFTLGAGIFFLFHTSKTHEDTIFTNIFKLCLIFLGVYLLIPITGIGLRTQTFSFLGLAYLLFVLSKINLTDKKGIPKRLLYSLPFVFMLWANLHGGFIYGLGLFGLLSLTLLIEYLPQLDKDGVKSTFLKVMTVLITSGLATLINPYGVKLHTSSIRMLLNQSSNIYNQDWGSILLVTDPHQIASVIVFTTWGLVILVDRKTKIHYKLTLGILLLLCLASKRFLLPLAMVLLPLLAVFIKDKISKRFSKYISVITGILVSLIVLIGSRNILSTYYAHQSFAHTASLTSYTSKVSAQSFKYIQEYGVPDNLFNNINWGGFLAWQIPNQTYMTDGKMDNYFIDGKSVAVEYIEIVSAKPGWNEKLDQSGINSVFLPPHYPIVKELLQSPDWTQVYGDDLSIILIRQQNNNAPIIYKTSN